MFFSAQEDKIMRPFAEKLDAHLGSPIKMKLQDGTELIVSFDTCYESDNDLEMDEEGYEEYFSYVFMIEKVLSVSKENAEKYKENTLFELNYHTIPLEMHFI